MKLQIVNIKKFIRSVVIILSILVGILLFVNNTTQSSANVKYKEIYISNGDTLWSIAKTEKENILYYENKDIRDIVSHIKAINKLDSVEIKMNQKLLIATM